MLSTEFLTEFKRTTEAKWRARPVDQRLYGFQIQRGTRWNPGLPDDKIAEYETSLGLRFPSDLRTLLRAMNGTDLPTVNVYGQSGEPPRQSVGVYSYPRDFELVRRRTEEWHGYRVALTTTLAEQGFDLAPEADLMPIYAHRCVVCDTDLTRSVVLSVWNKADAIVYGTSLQEYLETEFLR